MASRAFIWMKDGQKWRGVYCHSPGSPEFAGDILTHYYTSSAKIRKLIDMGDIYDLTPHLPSVVLWIDKVPDADPAEHAPKVANSVKEAIKITDDIIKWVGYAYFWDGKRWYCWDREKWTYYDYENEEWVPGRSPESGIDVELTGESHSRFRPKDRYTSESTRILLEIIRGLRRLEGLLD